MKKHAFFLHDEHVDHAHDDDHAANHAEVAHVHDHGRRRASMAALRVAAILTGGFAAVEAIGGWWSGSLALLSDAGHMLTDSVSLLLALLMSHVAQRPASERMSYGLGRAEAVGAFVNGLFMLGVIAYIVVEAIRRLLWPEPVNGAGVMVIATLGLLINLGVAWRLMGDAHDLNTRGALIHVLGDLLGSVAAIVAGLIIYTTGWTPADPILSMVVALLLLASTLRLLRQALIVLMEGVPEHLDYNSIGDELLTVPGVASVHDLHVWYMSTERVALSAHLIIASPQAWPQVLAEAQRRLSQRFDIHHATLQAEWAAFDCPCLSPKE